MFKKKNTTKSRSATAIWVIGALVSIGLVLVGYFWPQSQDVTNAALLGFIGATVTLILEIRVKLSDLETSVIDKISDIQTEREILAKSDDEFLVSRYRELKEELRQLAIGRYRLSSLAEVYQDNIRSMRALSKGERLLSTCPVSTVSTEDAIKQINNPHHKASIQEHIAAARRDVQVVRIYLFRNRGFFEVPEIKQHLLELARNGLDIRVIFRDEVELYTPIDFLVFGERKVSIGIINPDSGMCVGSQIEADPEAIKRSIRDYGVLERVSHRIEDLVGQGGTNALVASEAG